MHHHIRTALAACCACFTFLPCHAGTQIPPQSDSLLADRLRNEEGITFTHDNNVTLLMNGQKKFDDMFAAIRQARKSVHLEYFNFRNDSIAMLLFDILAEKVKDGVEVRALFDAFGNSSNNRPLKSRHIDSIRARGIQLYEFDPIRFPWVNHIFGRDHRKIVVIDGCVAYTGGMNVADYYITGRPEFGSWHDLHARVEGDAVGELQAVFLGFWNRVTGQNISGPQYYPGEKRAADYFPQLTPDTTATAGRKQVGVVNRDPHSTPGIIHDTFLEAISTARHSIRIINPYLTLCPHLKRALKEAAARGVDVQVMVSEKSDIPITPRIVEYNVNKLMRAGVKVYFYQGGFHHSKIMMIDSLYSFIGSANLNSRSLSFDYECNLLIADAPTTHQLISLFNRDRDEHCYLLTPELWKQLPKWKKFKGWFFHFLTPFVDAPKRRQGIPGMIIIDRLYA